MKNSSSESTTQREVEMRGTLGVPLVESNARAHRRLFLSARGRCQRMSDAVLLVQGCSARFAHVISPPASFIFEGRRVVYNRTRKLSALDFGNDSLINRLPEKLWRVASDLCDPRIDAPGRATGLAGLALLLLQASAQFEPAIPFQIVWTDKPLIPDFNVEDEVALDELLFWLAGAEDFQD
jgi:hypothetical protein